MSQSTTDDLCRDCTRPLVRITAANGWVCPECMYNEINEYYKEKAQMIALLDEVLLLDGVVDEDWYEKARKFVDDYRTK